MSGGQHGVNILPNDICMQTRIKAPTFQWVGDPPWATATPKSWGVRGVRSSVSCKGADRALQSHWRCERNQDKSSWLFTRGRKQLILGLCVSLLNQRGVGSLHTTTSSNWHQMWALGVCESRPWAHPPSCRHRSQPQQCLLQKCGFSPASSSAPWPLLCKVSSVCVHAVCFVSLMLLISRTIYKENQHLFSGEKSWDTRKLGAAFHCISIIWRQRRLCLISVRIRNTTKMEFCTCLCKNSYFFLCFHTMIKV